MSDKYPNLEPNHEVMADEEDGLLFVVCPFTDDGGNHFQTPWSIRAEPWEVNCEFCPELKRIERGDPLISDHGCDDTSEEEVV